MNMKRILSAALVLAMLVGLVPGAGVTAKAADDETTATKTITQTNTTATMTVSLTVPEKEPVAYIDADGTNKTTGTDYLYVTSDMTTWGQEAEVGQSAIPKWYVVDKNVTIDTVTVTGDVRLILCDGATLNAHCIEEDQGAEALTIYGQSAGTGKLIVTTANGPAIGGMSISLTVNGGAVEATSENGYAIMASSFTVNGGTVTAIGNPATYTVTAGDGMTIYAGDSAADAAPKESYTNEGWVYIEKGTPLTNVTYLDAEGASQTLEAGTSEEPGYTRVRPYNETWSAGWYVVDKDVTITNQIVVKGNINLILTDGATLTASKGITFYDPLTKFTVYGQSAGTGKLTSGEPVLGRSSRVVMTFNGGVIDISVGENKSEAPIGAEEIIVNGGSVSGTSAKSFGIEARSVTIHGGTVNAISNSDGSYAIGVNSSSITVNGGVLNTYGLYKAINSSYGGVTVNGGSLTARSEQCAIFANLTVTGGSVTVIGGDGGTGQNGKAISGSVTLGPGIQVKAGDAETETFVTDYVENHNNYRWARIAKFHTHTLSNYQLTKTNAEKDTITAECSNEATPCTLTPDLEGKRIATLTIVPKEDGTATLTGGADFGVSDTDIVYKKNGAVITASEITDTGFYEASITVGELTASVTYGVNEVKKISPFNATDAHGDFDVPEVATAKATVTIETTPAKGYKLGAITVTKDDNSTVDAAVDGNKGTFTMPEESVTVSAAFTLRDYTITTSGMTNGSVTAAATAKMGETVSLTVTPGTGYELDTLTVKDGENKDVTVTNNSFTMPADDVTITATFKKHNYTITKSAMTNGDVTVAATAQMDDTVEITVNPADGYQLSELKFNGTAITADGSGKYKFTMPPAEVTVSATFVKRDVGVKLKTKNGNETCAAALLTDSYDAAPASFIRKVDQTFVLSVATGEDYTFVVSGSTPIEFRQLTESEKDTFIEKYPECDANTQLFMVTMPAVATGDLTVTVEFKKIKVYTVLYQPTDQTTTEVWCKVGNDESKSIKSIEMQMSPDASMGDKKVFALNVSMADAPAKVAFATSNAFGGVTMANANLRESVLVAASWTNGFNGQYLVIGGYAKTVIAAFTPNNSTLEASDKNLTAMPEGTQYQIAVCGTNEKGVVTTPGKVNAPAKPERTGYVFEGWSGFEGAAPNVIEKLYSEGAEITLYDDAILSAAWHPQTFRVNLNLNGGEGQSVIDNVDYQGILSTLTDPTKANFVFDGWKVGKNVTESGTFYAKGSRFDTQTPITSNLELNAQWKHVHSYTCVPLDYEGFNGALNEYSKYFPYLHVNFCACGDVNLEAHTFRNGSCVDCGYTDPRSTTATLYVSYWKDNAEWMKEDTRTETIGGEVTVDAFWQIGQYRFSKWQYRTPSETTWHDLSADTMVGFIFPCALYVRALYVDTVTQPQVSLSARRYVTQAEGYDWDSVLFQMEYKLPSNCTYIDSGIRMGDNQGISFYSLKKRKVSAFETAFNFITSDPISFAVDQITSDADYIIEKREDNVLNTMSAETLAKYMMENKPINIPEYEPIYWQASPTTKGRSGSVNTLTPLRFIQKNNGKHYIYGVGWLRYKDKDGNIRTINTPALATTRDSVPGDTVTKTGQN